MKTIRRLPDSDLEVMQAIWVCSPPVSRADQGQALADTYPVAQTTLLTRLTEKVFVSAQFYLAA